MVCSCSLHSLCAGCITPGGRQLKLGFSDLKYLFVASHSFLCSPPAPCHDPSSCTETCTGASNSYSAQLQGSAREQVLGCDLIQGIFSRKTQFPAGTHTTVPRGQLPTEGAAQHCTVSPPGSLTLASPKLIVNSSPHWVLNPAWMLLCSRDRRALLDQ